MSDFDDRPLVAGGITGLRAFSVDRLGRLNAPYRRCIFTPGENVAKCTYGFIAHQVGQVGCSCGFYAYFDGKNDAYSRSTSMVEAVIEGTGTVTVGTRGFRAEKARLLALVIPSAATRKAPIWCRIANWLDRRALDSAAAGFGAVFGVATLGGAIALVVFVAWWFAPAFAVPLALGLLSRSGFHSIEHIGGERADCPHARAKAAGRDSADLELVRRNYPDVPVYSTTKAALKAHPLAPPPPPVVPSPETDDNFWTRADR